MSMHKQKKGLSDYFQTALYSYTKLKTFTFAILITSVRDHDRDLL